MVTQIIGPHGRRDLSYVICLRDSFRSRAGIKQKFFKKRPVFLYACARCSELPSDINTIKMVDGLQSHFTNTARHALVLHTKNKDKMSIKQR